MGNLFIFIAIAGIQLIGLSSDLISPREALWFCTLLCVWVYTTDVIQNAIMYSKRD